MTHSDAAVLSERLSQGGPLPIQKPFGRLFEQLVQRVFGVLRSPGFGAVWQMCDSSVSRPSTPRTREATGDHMLDRRGRRKSTDVGLAILIFALLLILPGCSGERSKLESIAKTAATS